MEQESKQRAQDEDQGDEERLAVNRDKQDDAAQPLGATESKDASTVEAVEFNTWPQDRRRGSVSISVFGQVRSKITWMLIELLTGGSRSFRNLQQILLRPTHRLPCRRWQAQLPPFTIL